MNYAERADAAQQEQLDWLSQIAEENKAQTELLRNISRHTAITYVATIIGLVVLGFWLMARLYDLING